LCCLWRMPERGGGRGVRQIVPRSTGAWIYYPQEHGGGVKIVSLKSRMEDNFRNIGRIVKIVVGIISALIGLAVLLAYALGKFFGTPSFKL
jgi:hypothetical protein